MDKALLRVWSWNTLFFCFLFVYFVESSDILDTTRLFSKEPEHHQTIFRIYGVAIERCEEECMHRKGCSSILYIRIALLCKLLSEDGQAIQPKGKTLFAKGFRESRQNFSPCLGVFCDDSQTCIPGDNGNTCKFTECGRPPAIYTVVNGNMYSIGNTVTVSTGSPFAVGTAGWSSRILCGEDGLWHSVNAQCLPGWKVFGNACYWLDSTPRTQASAESYCDNVVPGAYLTGISSEAEHNFLAEFMQQSGAKGAWLNAKYHTTDGLYYWNDGTAFDASFELWLQNEPNAPNTEHCVAYHRSSSGVTGIRDIDCRWTHHIFDPFTSICKQDGQGMV